MLQITCSGTPFEIGRQHGSQASTQVHGSKSFYSAYFKAQANLDWDAATAAAEKFLPLLEKEVPHLVEEMKGVAEGSGLPFSTILALNARSEIAMGMMNDGCTTVAWKTDSASVAGQNWDWEDAQQDRLIILNIKSNDAKTPSISQVTEAGIVGKIGINSSGVATCLNAMRVLGVNFNHLPIHIALRVALETKSRAEGVNRLTALGLGSAGHILVADKTGSTSLEFGSDSIKRLEMQNGRLAHANHFLDESVATIAKSHAVGDSPIRQSRALKLLNQAPDGAGSTGNDSAKVLAGILEDVDNFPVSINRKSGDGNAWSTLFSIVSDLYASTAVVKVGRPTEPVGTFDLKPLEI